MKDHRKSFKKIISALACAFEPAEVGTSPWLREEGGRLDLGNVEKVCLFFFFCNYFTLDG